MRLRNVDFAERAGREAPSVIGLDEAAVRRQLVALGVPREKANRAAAGDVQNTEHLSTAPAPAGPVTLVLPWSCLVSDNRHRGPVASRADHAAYKLARTRAHAEASEQWGPRAPFSGRVCLTVRVFAPDSRRRDIANYRKCLTDALEGVAYVNDAQIDDERWTRGAIDRDRPRAEITVEELIR